MAWVAHENVPQTNVQIMIRAGLIPGANDKGGEGGTNGINAVGARSLRNSLAKKCANNSMAVDHPSTFAPDRLSALVVRALNLPSILRLFNGIRTRRPINLQLITLFIQIASTHKCLSSVARDNLARQDLYGWRRCWPSARPNNWHPHTRTLRQSAHNGNRSNDTPIALSHTHTCASVHANDNCELFMAQTFL